MHGRSVLQERAQERRWGERALRPRAAAIDHQDQQESIRPLATVAGASVWLKYGRPRPLGALKECEFHCALQWDFLAEGTSRKAWAAWVFVSRFPS